MVAGEEAAVVDALTAAFHREELASWIDPEPGARRTSLHSMFTSIITASSGEYVIEVTDDLGAAAVWCPPEVHVAQSSQSDRSEVISLFRQIDELAPPGPHWYLAFLGAARRGEGGGSSLLAHRLGLIGDGSAALWTATGANVEFYARFRFEVFVQSEIFGMSTWWLLRPGSGDLEGG
jgi:hypothetical protein